MCATIILIEDSKFLLNRFTEQTETYMMLPVLPLPVPTALVALPGGERRCCLSSHYKSPTVLEEGGDIAARTYMQGFHTSTCPGSLYHATQQAGCSLPRLPILTAVARAAGENFDPAGSPCTADAWTMRDPDSAEGEIWQHFGVGERQNTAGEQGEEEDPKKYERNWEWGG